MLSFTFTLPEAAYEEAMTFLTLNAPQGWEENADPASGDVTFTVFVESEESIERLTRKLAESHPGVPHRTGSVLEADWARSWMDFFTPVTAGGVFEVLPPWLAEEGRADRTPIIIEPKMAFGTGHHPTTALCLEEIGKLVTEGAVTTGMRFLDLGTGSGILGIALAKVGLSGVGLDIDPEATLCAAENAVVNDCADRFAVATGGIESLAPTAGFELIVANILSGPLIALSGEVVSRLKPGGRLILSGILTEQAPAVAAAYRALGLGPERTAVSGEWAALVW